MKSKVRVEFKPDAVDLVNFGIKYFRVFVITGFVTALLSGGISLLIKPLYESTVILYPSSNIAETRTMLGEASSEASVFGDDDATERLIQILKSEQVRDYLKAKYDLASHYNIKPGHRYPNTLIAQKMKKYIRSSKTSFGSVEIRVRDRDREIACLMANDIAARADTIFNNIQREAAAKVLSEINKSYEMQLRLVKQYEDSLTNMPGQWGLRIYSTLESETEYLALIRGRYLETQALSQQTLPYTLVVDKATVAEKKVYPKRSYMVIVSTASLLLLVALVLFVAEGVKLHRTDGQL